MATDDNPVTNAEQPPAAGETQSKPAADAGNAGEGESNKAKQENNKQFGSRKQRHAGFGGQKRRAPDSRDASGPRDERDRAQARRVEKRRKVIESEANGESYMSINFTPEEIAAEERRPKRKVAVLIGYAGTGYSGLQMNHKEKTIEGDIFGAFVAAGAISKANADDPKKSSFVRCARTDKGVHAAGNVLSLKLIVEDEDIVDKINSHLPPQIRVWDIQRTNNGFSSYQACDSRWYEYLMPSYALLPPLPESFLGKKVIESAKEKGVYEEYQKRLDDIQGFWEEVEKNDIEPILEKLSPEVRAKVVEAFKGSQVQDLDEKEEVPVVPDSTTSDKQAGSEAGSTVEAQPANNEGISEDKAPTGNGQAEGESQPQDSAPVLGPVESAIKEIKAAYVAAKRRYRVTPARLAKFQEALNLYVGTHNFHNYTVMKSVNDPSARRHIKSFVANPTPIPIRDTEWLSIKVHGQSFMMHQIRKMIAMAVMVTRCGAPLDIIPQSYGPRRISIPKAPGLGLMLERPMFVEYNKRATTQLGRDPIDFAKYEERIQKFKDSEIYSRMFETEERENAFHTFFHQIDNFRTDYFLWVTAGGFESAYERSDRGVEKIPKALAAELGGEADGVEEGDS